MVCSLVSITFDSPQLGKQLNKVYKTLEYWSRYVFNFGFLEKGLGIVFLPHFLYDISRKMFLMLYPINWPYFIAWLSILLEILVNIVIDIVINIAIVN